MNAASVSLGRPASTSPSQLTSVPQKLQVVAPHQLVILKVRCECREARGTDHPLAKMAVSVELAVARACDAFVAVGRVGPLNRCIMRGAAEKMVRR